MAQLLNIEDIAEIDGDSIEFPDDATPEEMSRAVNEYAASLVESRFHASNMDLGSWSRSYAGSNFEANPEKWLPSVKGGAMGSSIVSREGRGDNPRVEDTPANRKSGYAGKEVGGFFQNDKNPQIIGRLDTVAPSRDQKTPLEELVHMKNRERGMENVLGLLDEEERGAWDGLVELATTLVLPMNHVDNKSRHDRDAFASAKALNKYPMIRHDEVLGPLMAIEGMLPKGLNVRQVPVIKDRFFPDTPEGDARYAAFRKLADDDTLISDFEAAAQMGTNMMFNLTVQQQDTPTREPIADVLERLKGEFQNPELIHNLVDGIFGAGIIASTAFRIGKTIFNSVDEAAEFIGKETKFKQTAPQIYNGEFLGKTVEIRKHTDRSGEWLLI